MLRHCSWRLWTVQGCSNRRSGNRTMLPACARRITGKAVVWVQMLVQEAMTLRTLRQSRGRIVQRNCVKDKMLLMT